MSMKSDKSTTAIEEYIGKALRQEIGYILSDDERKELKDALHTIAKYVC